MQIGDFIVYQNKIGEPSKVRELKVDRVVTIRDIQFQISRHDRYTDAESNYTLRYKRNPSQEGSDIYITLSILQVAFDLHAFYNLLGTPESRGLGLELLCFMLKTVFEDEPWKALGFARPDTIDLLAYGGGPQSNSKKPISVEGMQTLVQYYERLGFRRTDPEKSDKHQDLINGVYMDQSVDSFLQNTCYTKFATTLAKKAEIIGVGGIQTLYKPEVPKCTGASCLENKGGGGGGGSAGGSSRGGSNGGGSAKPLTLAKPNFTYFPGSSAAKQLAELFTKSTKDLDTTVESLSL